MRWDDPTWSEEELEQAVAWLVQAYLRSPRGIEPTHAQGRLAEQLVMHRLNDIARVGMMLAVWRKTSLPTEPVARRKAAASNPDWLILDQHGDITAIVEVKAVRGDAHSIDEDRHSYRLIWSHFPEAVTAPLEDWQRRMARAWIGHGPHFGGQITNHLNRLVGLAEAGLMRYVDSFLPVLYVPRDERYFDIPPTIHLKGHTDRPLVIQYLPRLETMIGMLERAHLIAYDGRPFPIEKLQSGGHSTADEGLRRMPAMQAMLPSLHRMFETTTTGELDGRLARLVLGEKTLHNLAQPDHSLSWRHPEGLLERLHSVAPSFTAHILFEAVGRRNGSSSRQERELFYGVLADRQMPLSAEQAFGLLASVTRIRIRLRNREWPLPPMSETLEQAFK